MEQEIAALRAEVCKLRQERGAQLAQDIDQTLAQQRAITENTEADKILSKLRGRLDKTIPRPSRFCNLMPHRYGSHPSLAADQVSIVAFIKLSRFLGKKEAETLMKGPSALMSSVALLDGDAIPKYWYELYLEVQKAQREQQKLPDKHLPRYFEGQLPYLWKTTHLLTLSRGHRSDKTSRQTSR